jgi:hypothetical protein
MNKQAKQIRSGVRLKTKAPKIIAHKKLYTRKKKHKWAGNE